MKKISYVFAVIFLGFVAFSAQAASEISGADNGFAIEGYDTVAYFTDSIATKGDAQFSTEWRGAKWLFVNSEHLDLFIADPEQYAPQYGGYCAYATAHNGVADGAPERWKIVDQKLYLNTNIFAHKLWQNDIPGNISSADQNWPEVQNKS